jgi:hypothetical protein
VIQPTCLKKMNRTINWRRSSWSKAVCLAIERNQICDRFVFCCWNKFNFCSRKLKEAPEKLTKKNFKSANCSEGATQTLLSFRSCWNEWTNMEFLTPISCTTKKKDHHRLSVPNWSNSPKPTILCIIYLYEKPLLPSYYMHCFLFVNFVQVLSTCRWNKVRYCFWLLALLWPHIFCLVSRFRFVFRLNSPARGSPDRAQKSGTRETKK